MCQQECIPVGMRTARLLTVSQHALWLGGAPGRGCTYQEGGVPARGVPAWVVYLPEVVCTCPGGVPA